MLTYNHQNSVTFSTVIVAGEPIKSHKAALLLNRTNSFYLSLHIVFYLSFSKAKSIFANPSSGGIINELGDQNFEAVCSSEQY